MSNKTSSAFWIKLLVILSVVLILSFIFLDIASKPAITLEEKQQTKNLCRNLQLPPSFVVVHQSNTEKTDSAVYLTNYSSTTKIEEVEEYFVTMLKKSGWQYEKNNLNSPTVQLKFRKDKYRININYIDPSLPEENLYTVTCSIGTD